ncbi:MULTISPECIES: RhuM family protein [Spongiibacter]|uniref:RhuM family protein n=1 Tax=Spongiibacter TaxID=630749 RepID=UPI000C3ADFC6|nr:MULTISPECIES: RhuM family protein [Spongiibacter]MAY39341.1 hypothetical protein [Spongiibacter sp.]MBI58949.1 hypothetical protein [Spongiibacter sp.]|tara:strand:+ start:630 stop:1622 length:993 start_codon:yes stop_codon:yes gene_type:complete
MSTNPMNELLIFETDQQQVEVRLQGETLWATQSQIAELFATSTDNIGLHLKNIYQDKELDEGATTEDFSVVRQEGKRQVRRTLTHYNLDAIISVGYRVNSSQATRFRQWSTRVLREYLTQGYALDKARFERNAAELEQALLLIQRTAKRPELSSEAGRGLVDIVSRYTQTFLWLQRYDEGLLEEPEGQSGGTLPSPEEGVQALLALKQQLIEKGEATDLFARPREEGLAGIFGNLDQTVFGEPAYPSVESKAAHLLYFVVKNHPFSDGNKRSGAFLFVDFLHRNGRLLDVSGNPVINDTGLAALTLLVAESDPKQKEVLIRLIMHMLSAA